MLMITNCTDHNPAYAGLIKASQQQTLYDLPQQVTPTEN